jgi:hypothetical protein
MSYTVMPVVTAPTTATVPAAMTAMSFHERGRRSLGGVVTAVNSNWAGKEAFEFPLSRSQLPTVLHRAPVHSPL